MLVAWVTASTVYGLLAVLATFLVGPLEAYLDGVHFYSLPVAVWNAGMRAAVFCIVLQLLADVRKLVASAVANARVQADKAGERFDERELVITSIMVDEGPTMKRIRPRAQGRAARILKRSCHITVVVATPDVAAKEGAR